MSRRRRRRLVRTGVTFAVLVVAVVAIAGLSGHGARGRLSAAPPAPTAASGALGAPASTRRTTTVPAAYTPPPVTPVIAPALPGEGRWQPVDTWAGGAPSVLTTSFRPDATQPTVVAYGAWLRTSATQLALYPGYEGPGATALDRGPEMVPVAARANLLATFNSGFYEADAAAGFYTHGTLYFPMVDGLATVVTFTNGTVDIVDWQGGPTPGPNVLMARQNLNLLVDGGAPSPSTSVGSEWGVTLYGAPAVWRTALGVDRRGNLLYVAAPSQTAASLAQIMVQLGAVRAMQLDINPEWPIFVSYAGPGALSPSLFVPNPNQIPNRFLYASTKDFFAVYQRLPGVTQVPW